MAEAEDASAPLQTEAGAASLDGPAAPGSLSLAMVEVHFLPLGASARVPAGTVALDAAAEAAITLEAPCGGRRLCGKCRVAFVGDPPDPTAVERELIGAGDLAAGVRLACRARLETDATLRLLPPARVDWWKMAATDLAGVEPDPCVHTVRCQLPAATLSSPAAITTRLRHEVGALSLPLAVLRSLSSGGGAAPAGGALQAVVVGEEIVDVWPCGGGAVVAPPLHGVAVDIGTTTIVGYLMDLRSGRQLAAASAMNPQASFGADIISRLHAILDDPHNLTRLRELVVGAVARIIVRACREAGCPPESVYEVTIAANTCMQHLFLGLDASPLAVSPFAPVVTEALDLPAAEVGLPIHPRGRVYVLPNVAGFVGSDAVAGLLASGLAHDDRWRLFLDIGTNAEIVLGRRGRLLTCSAAAGPAFEGGNISCGTVAREGAVSRVRWEGGQLRVETVGGSAATGVCGSGLIDAVCTLVDLGVVLPSGLLPPPERWSAAARAGVRWAGSPGGVVLAEADRPVVLTQGDVRQLQLAKGAVRAACEILLRTAGIEATDLGEVLLAGAFGNYLDPGSALELGLLPAVPPQAVRSIGNASGTGAKLALLVRAAREEATVLRDAAEYVELSVHPEFQAVFMEALALGSEDRRGINC